MQPKIPLGKITALPAFYSTSVTEDHLDVMGHMNVRWYMSFFDEAGWHLFESFGMDEGYYRHSGNGGFALQQHIRYLAEVRVGEAVSIYGRLVGHSEKRIHFMLFMVNTSTGMLAATLEALGSHADLSVRRTSPYPPDIKARIEALYNEHHLLDWDAPLCGVIHA